jgi:hypothetical protein
MQIKKKYKISSIVLLSLWVMIMFVLLLLPNDMLSQNRTSLFNIPYSDKIMHCGLFCVFAFLFHTTLLCNTNLKTKRIYVISVCVFLFFGIFTEILQALTFEWGGRRFEVKDYISDILGGCIGLLFLKIIEKKIKKRLQYEK